MFIRNYENVILFRILVVHIKYSDKGHFLYTFDRSPPTTKSEIFVAIYFDEFRRHL